MKQRIDGDDITNALRAFNRWRDEFLIELSTLLLLVGFVMGTIDILARKGIAVQGWFTVTWAIVQAIAIDGLFFAVWSRVARAEWTWRTAPKNVSMIVVGLILALVAMVVNGILGYQQVAGIADSFAAMTALHISASAFALTRAILVVAVALLVQLLCRSYKTNDNITNDEHHHVAIHTAQPLTIHEQPHETHTDQPLALPEHTQQRQLAASHSLPEQQEPANVETPFSLALAKAVQQSEDILTPRHSRRR